MFRQVSLSHRKDAHRVELLRRAVIVQVWTPRRLSRIATNILLSQEKFKELEAAVQLNKETCLANAMKRAKGSRAVNYSTKDVVPIYCTEQSKYFGKHWANKTKQSWTFYQS